MAITELVGKEFEIEYKNNRGTVRDFEITVTEAWTEGRDAYIKGKLYEEDSELTFRLDRILNGIPNVKQYIPKKKYTAGVMPWVLFFFALFITVYFIF